MYGPITDPSNPFDIEGISDEDRALLGYLLDAKQAGHDVVATCTTDHPTGATRHLQQGTNGTGLAIDCRISTRGNDIHRSVFNLFVPVEAQLYELIYAAAPYNIKAGKRVTPYATKGHHDHVHVAVNKGTFLKWVPMDGDDDMTSAERAQLALAASKANDAVNYAVDAQKRLEDIARIVVAISARVGA